MLHEMHFHLDVMYTIFVYNETLKKMYIRPLDYNIAS